MDKNGLDLLWQQAGAAKILVVGDLMLDEYLWGRTERISPEAPVQIVEVSREDVRLGGAGNVVNNLLALGCQVSVCSVVGADDNGRLLLQELQRRGAELACVVEEVGRVTGKKTRVLATGQQIVRIDREVCDPVSSGSERELIEYLQWQMHRFDAVIVSDYAKGVLTRPLLSRLCKMGLELAIPVVVDPKGKDFSRYSGATAITPNRKELEMAYGASLKDQDSLERAATELLSSLQLQALLLTRSEAGMSLFSDTGEMAHIPTIAREVFDVTGAGDTVIAAFTLALACKVVFSEAAWLANLAAGIVVGKVGTSTVTPAEITATARRLWGDSDGKIKSVNEVARIVAAERGRGREVVFTNGCFDLLHFGHVMYLQKARELGDLLVVGLNTDASVRRLKGEDRPLIAETERAHILAALSCVDHVVFFDEDTPFELVSAIRPDIIAKGQDYSVEQVVGRDIVESQGGRVALIELVGGHSTTTIIEKIKVKS